MEDEEMSSEQRVVRTEQNTNGSDWIYEVPKGLPAGILPLRDVSFDAVWTLSSCKTDGFGIYELMDESVDKYWQSDGPQPHTVTIEFRKKTDLALLFLYLDFKNDESYTPSKILVFVGNSLMHLNEPTDHEFSEPSGWQQVDLRDKQGRPTRAMVIQIQIVQNHQNGRDSHIRHIRVAGPRVSRFDPSNRLVGAETALDVDAKMIAFNTFNHKFMSSMNIR